MYNVAFFILLIVCLFGSSKVFGQLVYYQDTFAGGVTGGGYTPGFTSNAGEITVYITPNSAIRKALLFVGVYNFPDDRMALLNGVPVLMSSNNAIEPRHYFNSGTGLIFDQATLIIDVTDIISETMNGGNIVSIAPPIGQPSLSVGGKFVEYYLMITYENPNMDVVNVAAVVNQQDYTGLMDFEINGINTINLDNPVGFAIHSSHLCNNTWDGSYINIDNSTIGLIGGPDINNPSPCGGSTGTFYYQNNSLFGLSDDVPNNTMNGSDALADISEYLMNDDNIYVQITYQTLIDGGSGTPTSNAIWQFFFAYSTPCQPFETTLTEEVTICRGESAQLLATGGSASLPAAYEWLPQEDLSCYDCPNPVFLGDSTRHYTVRIWNTDSCSKVLPVKVLVYDVPTQANLNLNPATCSESNGSLSISNVVGGTPQYVYNIGGNSSTNPNFNNLAPGVYNLQITDANTCTYNQAFTIDEINPVTAAFNANPQQGVAPLNVNFANQSSGANSYQWLVNTQTFEGFNLNYTFDTAGNYPVQLIATYNEPHCADTALKVVVVENDFSVIIPTLFHSSQGTWGITTSNVVQIKAQVYNAIGQLIHQTEQTANNGPNPIWPVNENATGYYFYRLQLTDVEGKEHGYEGKVLVVR
jgi:PKD repeat protein